MSFQPNVELMVDPKQPPVSWFTFLNTAPAYSVALDGYVSDGPKFVDRGDEAKFNHRKPTHT